MGSDNPEYEFAKDRTPDPTPYPGEAWQGPPENTPARTAAELMHEGIVAVVHAADKNPVRLYCAIARLGGLSYAEIGLALDISKQGVDKHLRCVQRRNQALGRELRNGRRSYCEAIAKPLMRRTKTRGHVCG